MPGEVPFTGVPAEIPRLEPTPGIHVNAEPQAFGTNVAEAISHLGQVEESSGKEMFDRAYAMQELKVQSDVLQRNSSAQLAMNNAFVGYKEKEGQAAVEGLPDYQGQLDKALSDNRQGLSPYGQLLYDQEARNYRGRMLLYGSEHAADENKSYFIKSTTASMDMAKKGVELNPDDPKGVEAALDKVRQLAGDRAIAGGAKEGDPQYQKAVSDEVNNTLIGQIRALGQTQPVKAMELFNQAKTKGEIYGEDAARTYQWLKIQRDTIGARHNAGAVLNQAAGFGLDQRVLDQKGALAGLTGSEGGAKYYNWAGADQWDQAHQNYGHPIGAYSVMSYNLQSWLRQAGMGPMTEAEFKASPAAQDQLAWLTFDRYQQKYGSADAAATAWFAGEGSVKAELTQLSDGKTNGAEYLNRFHRGVAQGASEADISKAARTVAASQFPGDDDFADANENFALTQWHKEDQIQKDTFARDSQTLWDSLINGVGPNHTIPTSPDELKLDPNAGPAWQELAAKDPKALQQFINQMAKNAKGDVALTAEREQNWQRLAGLQVNDPEAFMKETQDISKVDLPLTMKRQIIAWQRDIYKRVDANPQMTHAMQYLNRTGILPAAGLTKDQDQDGLNLFTGVLHDIMTDYQLRNDKPMTDQEIETTATKLLQRTHAGWLGGALGQGPLWFQSIDTVPDEERQRIISMPVWQGAVPSDEQILKIYLAAQYNALQSAPTSGPK